jgi:hypothetical protein
MGALSIYAKLKLCQQLIQYQSDCYNFAYLLSALILPLFTHRIAIRSNTILGSSVGRSKKINVLMAVMLIVNGLGLKTLQLICYQILQSLMIGRKCIDLNEILINNELDSTVDNKTILEIFEKLKHNDKLIFNKDLFNKYMELIHNGYSLQAKEEVQVNTPVLQFIRQLFDDISVKMTNLDQFYGSIELYKLQLSEKTVSRLISTTVFKLYFNVLTDFSNKYSTLEPLKRVRDELKLYNAKYLQNHEQYDQLQQHIHKSLQYTFLKYIGVREKNVIKYEFEYNIDLYNWGVMAEFKSKKEKYNHMLQDKEENDKLISYLHSQQLVFPYTNESRIPYYEYILYRDEGLKSSQQNWYGVTLLATCLINYGLLKYFRIV